MSELLGYIASALGSLMGLAPLLQARLMLKTKIGEGISITYMGVICVGAASWVAYGISISNWFLIVPNAIGVVSTIIVIMLARHYGREDSSTPSR